MKTSNFDTQFTSKEALAAELFHESYLEYGNILGDVTLGGEPFRVRLDRMIQTICQLHDEGNVRFPFSIMTQHGLLRDLPQDERNPVEIICRVVADGMAGGEIPRRELQLMAIALIGIIVEPATARIYGRLEGGLLEHADDIVATGWCALSKDSVKRMPPCRSRLSDC